MKTTDQKTTITQRDLENPQRFIGEGLGAPEFEVIATRSREATGVHCVRTV